MRHVSTTKLIAADTLDYIHTGGRPALIVSSDNTPAPPAAAAAAAARNIMSL